MATNQASIPAALRRRRDDAGPALFSYGFRPFFLGAAIWAALGMLLWLPQYFGELTLPTAFGPLDWHIHEMIYGYVGAVIAGFLLTAIPNWTGRLPVNGMALAGLAGLWVAGRAAYAGTRTQSELRAVLDRDGLISGSSAGATIQGSYLVRGSRRSNKILMAPGYERGFGYLSNVAIDQHVTQRGRDNDLAKVVAAHPGLLGIGIDESTAVIVQGNAMAVIGKGVVRITDGAEHAGEPFYALKPGAHFDLASWQAQ